MFQGIWHKTEPSGVTQSEEPTPPFVEANRIGTSLDPCTVLNHVVTQFSKEPGGHKLSPIGNPERVIVAITIKRTHTKFAVGIKGSTPKDVAGISDLLRIRLTPSGKFVDECAEEANTAISASQAENSRIKASSFLLWHL